MIKKHVSKKQKIIFKEAAALFFEFCETVATLRHPKKGCPWDLEQTHASLRKYMIEEAYEASAVMCEKKSHENIEKLFEELGDVLLQVVLNAQLGSDERSFDIRKVIQSINQKMIRRHPHVFDVKQNKIKKTPAQVLKDWDGLKAQEKKKEDSTHYFQEIKKHPGPASTQAIKIGNLAGKINFDWKNPLQVLDVLKSEIIELEKEIKAKHKKNIYEEMGDVYFSLTQLCRHLEIEPELVALDANKKFLARFAQMEKMAKKEKLDIKKLSLEKLEMLWQRAKKME